MCKHSGASGDTHLLGSNDLYEEQQHTAPSPPKSTTHEDRGEMHGVYKHHSYKVAKKVSDEYETPSQSAVHFSDSNVTKKYALPVQSIYIHINIYISASEFVPVL